MPIRNILICCLLTACFAVGDQVCMAAEISGAKPIETVPPHSSKQGRSAANARVTYANVRYQYTIDYPGNLLVQGQEADDGDGVVFSAKSGTARVTVWGRFNAAGDTPAEIMRSEEHYHCDGARASYEVSKRDLVVFSCETPKNRIVYQKTIIHGDTLVAVQFAYPSAEQSTWAPVIKQMTGSLRIE